VQPKSAPVTSTVTFPVDKFQSYPAEVGSSAPLDPILPTRRVEFPQEVTATAPEIVTHWAEPRYEPARMPQNIL
jgi:hypothetical protein